ncbi:helix-turn-helix domain-containing protein [Micromonospora sp. SL1-18]|uniref:helix-turn-helix domain-containing protein n=1 Tax=Micromonospora sp. SL1-18 TaxID=3399128 RepID=UPI003A4E47A0
MDFDMWIRALKAARASADVSQERMASLVKWSPSTVAAIETGRRRPTMEFAAAADEALETGGLLAELLEAADRERSPNWFASWRSYELQAVRLRAFEPCLIPGLLQTEEYARAIISAGGLIPPDQVDEVVSVRLERQELLTRNEPTELIAIMDESALRRPVGGPAVLDAQLGRLLEMARLPHVRLHVIPNDVGAHVGLASGFILADLPGDEQVLYLETAARGQVVDDPDALRLIRRKWDSLLGEALSERASQDLITKLKVTT